MSAVLAPLLGYVIDRSGRNVAWVMLSCVLTLIAHCLLVIQKGQGLAYTAMVILGFGYSMLASSLWPIIAMVVPLHRQGTAYGKQFGLRPVTTTYCIIQFGNKYYHNIVYYQFLLIFRGYSSYSERWFRSHFLSSR